ncbi:MAG: DUF4347 domain-containing protein [Magnetococcales bacterium]|nr:DUF4347 domain-containing protein [Magnetococcales bacterium]
MSWFSKINSTFSKNGENLFNRSSPPPYMGNKFLVEPIALEPRVLFDGAGLHSAIDINVEENSQVVAETQKAVITDNIIADALAHSSDNLHLEQKPKQIVFIASDVTDIDTLLAGVDPAYDVILLDANRDGVSQIAETLGFYSDLDAIHIISHGDDGQVNLGNNLLSNNNILQYSTQLAQWGDALNSNGDILFYGCDVGAGVDGVEFIEQLSQLTNADIAASDDITGATNQGGDWVLEKTEGIVETSTIFTVTAQENYSGILADTYTVTTATEEAYGGTETTAAPDGTGLSLQEAVGLAAAGDTITFSTSLASSTITLTSAITIAKNLTIEGDFDGSGDNVADITISGGGANLQGLLVTAGTVNLNSLTIDNFDYTASGGGAIDHTGGTLNLNNSTVKNSTATLGGGIYSSSTINITESSVQDNTSTSNGGNLYITSTGTLTTTDTTISGGSSGAWGGAFLSFGTASLTRTTISSNSASGSAGGIYSSGTLTITNSTISGNSAAGSGGGLYLSGANTNTINHSTIAFNISDNNDSGSTGGGIYRSNSTVNMSHNIVSNNYQDSASSVASDLQGTFGTLDYNLFNDVAGATWTTNTNSIATDPNLQSLANNGGSVKTHALLASSSAVNAGNPSVSSEPTYDSRSTGYSRKVGTIDLGSYERALPSVTAVSIPNTAMNVGDTVTATITTASDDGVSLKNISGTIGGFSLNSLVRSGTTSYTAEFVIKEGGTDVTGATDLGVSLTIDDYAGNTSAAYTTSISQASDTIDANSPVISATAWSTTSGDLITGDSVNLTVTADATGLSVSTATINGVDVSSTFVDNADNTYTFTYTVANGDDDIADSATIPIVITLAESSGNTTGSYTTTPAASLSPGIDATLPTLFSVTPADDASYISLTDNLVLTFSSAVDVESGNITIMKTSDSSIVEAIDITSSLVTGTGTTTITVNPSVSLALGTQYYILIDATAFDDSAGNSYAGITSSTAWNFNTEPDVTAPTLSSFTPTSGASDTSTTANLVLNFSEIVDVESGNITIYKKSDKSIVETIAVTSSQVTGTGTTTITIDPSVTLDYGTQYYIKIDATAFDDTASNSYAGISVATDWSFTTAADIIAPTVSTFSPTNSATQVTVTSDLILTFSENVYKNSGNITILKDGGSIVETIAVTSGQIAGEGTNTITINPSSNLSDGTTFYILIDSNAFVDYANNKFAGLTVSSDWKFSTIAEAVTKEVTTITTDLAETTENVSTSESEPSSETEVTSEPEITSETEATTETVTQIKPETNKNNTIKTDNEEQAEHEAQMAEKAELLQAKKDQKTLLFKKALAELDLIDSKGFSLPNKFPDWFPELTSNKIALFIGINNYQGLIPDLNTPNHDVTEVSEILENRGFQTIVLKDVSYQKLMEAFRGISEKIKSGQDLVIYYAGHGYLREDSGKAYWIMGDAKSDSSKKWVSTEHISNFLASVKANKTLLISDSCYSGSLTKEGKVTNTTPTAPTPETQERRSVVTMSSGGEEPVADGGSEGHSIFAYNLIKALKSNNGLISGTDLFTEVRDGVTENFPQTPQYGAVLSAGHEEGADFFFNNSNTPSP